MRFQGRVRKALLGAMVCLAAVAVPLVATAAERPKIGLVLSGGGARGAAHIGVIRVLEEMRVPVDYIAGTSMGSIVGGLYAAGMSPDELEKALLAVDWSAAFRDQPSREDLAFRRKQDQDDYPVNMQLGWRDKGLRMPRGLIQGQNLNAILTSLTTPVALVSDFDNLAIPYRAVAADVVTGERVVLGSGTLATAMRASMSVPAVFSPVEIEGRMLVDGGIASNLPVQTVREMGADVVIAVDISTPLASKEVLQSALSITVQLTGLLTRRNTEAEIETLTKEDILIVPDLGEIGSGSFDRVDETLPLGESAARAAAAKLGRLALSPRLYEDYLTAMGRPDPSPPVIEFVRVDNDADISKEVITSRLLVRLGEPLDAKKLKEGLDQVYGLGMFERVESSLVKEGGRTGLLVSAKRKSWGPNYINMGMELESDIDGGSSFNVSGRLTVTELNKWGAEWRVDLQAGERPHVITELYQPLKAYSRYFVAPRLELEEFTVLLFDGDMASSNYRINRTLVGLDLGRHFGSWGEVRLGIFRENANAELKIGNVPVLLETENLVFPPRIGEDGGLDGGGLRVGLDYDSFDNLNFPRRGTRGSAKVVFSMDSLGADETFQSAAARLSHARTFGWNTVILNGRVGSVYDGNAPIQNTFNLGGLFSLSGLGRNQLRGQHSLFGALAFYRQMFGRSASPPNFPVYLGFSLEAGNVWQERSDIALDTFALAGSLFVGLDTFMGPIYVAYGLAEEGSSAFYFFLGRGF